MLDWSGDMCGEYHGKPVFVGFLSTQNERDPDGNPVREHCWPWPTGKQHELTNAARQTCSGVGALRGDDQAERGTRCLSWQVNRQHFLKKVA